jgi:hypothetical protein
MRRTSGDQRLSRYSELCAAAARALAAAEASMKMMQPMPIECRVRGW